MLLRTEYTARHRIPESPPPKESPHPCVFVPGLEARIPAARGLLHLRTGIYHATIANRRPARVAHRSAITGRRSWSPTARAGPEVIDESLAR